MDARREEVIGHTEATAASPQIGDVVVVMSTLFRCVSITYADPTETQTGVAEVRVRYKQEDGDGADRPG